MKMSYERDELLHDLRLHPCEIRFVKVNGEERVMHCTLLPEHLPQGTDVHYLDEEHKKPENKDIIVCWDLQKNAWRSFRVESVTDAQIISGY